MSQLTSLTENDIINNAYYLLEKASELWDTASDEYLTARGLGNIAIGRWQRYENTKWKELLRKASAGSGATLTLTNGVYTYSTPNDCLYPTATFVRTTDAGGGVTTWQVIDSKERLLHPPTDYIAFFTGNSKLGFTLNFNSGLSLKTGEVIDYDYYRSATLFTATTSVTEVPDPDYISYYIAAHMAEEGIDTDMYNMAEARLEQMRTQNMSQLFGVSNNIIQTPGHNAGFGY